jgi:hypothetical protein
MPTKTFRKPARTISSQSSGSSARFSDASVRKPTFGWVRSRHATSSRSRVFVRLLSPMKLSSTTKTIPFQPPRSSASISPMSWPGDLVRGACPFITTMSQKSQS